MPTDDELILSSIKGSEPAFTELMKRYLNPVYNFAVSLTGNKEDAEDVAQETFFKAWKHLKRFRTGSPFKAWVFAIARNTTIDYARKKKPALFAELTRPLIEEDFEHTLRDTADNAETIFDQAIDVETVGNALSRLSTPYREVLTLHYREEFTLQEISVMLKIPLNTVKSRDRRALKALRELLAPEST